MQTRRYSASTVLRADVAASVGSGGDTKAGLPAALAPAGSRTTRVFWVQRSGARSSAKLETSAADVGDLAKEIKKELPSLRDVGTDSITLQLASADGTLFRHAKDATGNEQPVTLNSMDTLDVALKKAADAAGRPAFDPDEKLRIIVDVATPAATTAPAAAAAFYFTPYREFFGFSAKSCRHLPASRLHVTCAPYLPLFPCHILAFSCCSALCGCHGTARRHA